MTAPCISASLQNPALPSTSASEIVVVGIQSLPPRCPLLASFLFFFLTDSIAVFRKTLNPTSCFFFQRFSTVFIYVFFISVLLSQFCFSLSPSSRFLLLTLQQSIDQLWQFLCSALLSFFLFSSVNEFAFLFPLHSSPHNFHVHLLFPKNACEKNSLSSSNDIFAGV